MLANLWLAVALAGGTAAPAGSAAPSMDDLLRRPQYETVTVSPDGSALAIAYRVDDGTVVTVVNRADMKAVAQINPGSRAEVAAMAWLDTHRLLVAANRSIGPFSAPIVNPALYLVDITSGHRLVLPSTFMRTIEGDHQHVLVSNCKRFDDKGKCLTGVERIDLDHIKRDGETIATAPIADADFLIDHAGKVRMAWGWNSDGRSRLYRLDTSGAWQLVNDSDVSHVAVAPIGISRDNRTAFLDTERVDAPDAIESYDLDSGVRTLRLADPVSDPLRPIRSLDRREPIGAWFGPGRPQARYFDPASTDAKWQQALAKAFPDTNASITSASDDGSVVVIHATSDRDSGTFYLLDSQTHKLRLLFHDRPWLDASAMAPALPIAFSARDGQPLHGFLTLPAGASKHAPMVVMVHGGPYYVRDGWTFDEDAQLLAAHGYAVLRVNFRGSSGFGLSFVQRGYRQWGAAMQDDVTDATRWAIEQGYADPQRICIYGASYGGYAALMGAAREPALYRCAVGLSGVYDLNRLYSWGDIHRSDYGMYYLDLVLGRDKATLAARSPATLAPKIEIPVLLAHGTLDGRVPVKYAQEMRKAMKRAGHPVEYVTYDYEGHTLFDPGHRRDFYTRLLKFLDQHIGALQSASLGP